MARNSFNGLSRRLAGLALALGLVSPLAPALAAAAPPGATAAPRSVPGFEEPLVSTLPDTPPAEATALSQAIAHFDPKSAEGLADFDRFLAAYPDSGWRLAVQTNIGLWYYREGYFSRAIAAWENAWAIAQTLPDAPGEARALADRAVGELIRMHARLGHSERLKELLKAVDGRPLVGPATELVAGAKQGLWMMDNDPGVAYLCGPNALRKVALLSKPAGSPEVKLLEKYRSGQQGVSLGDVGKLAKAANVPLRPAYRLAKAPIPVPSVVHWKVSHYAAIVGQEGGRYHIQDPTFGTDLWISRDALEKESSGFFLVPTTATAGWRDVTVAEANSVHGMGFTSAGDPNATRPDDPKAKPPCGNGGMCGYNAHSMNVSLNLVDTPMGYSPAVGPDVHLQLTYNQREARQPAVATFFNFGPKWTSNWLAYVVDVPNRPGINVMSYARGGGAYDEAGYNANSGKFLPEPSNYSVLRLISANPIQYERRYKDGSTEVFTDADGAAFYPRRVFLSRVVDPAGNAVTLTYDSSKRVTKLTDAVGRITKFTYANASFPLQPTKVTDPFNRSANIAYDATGRLSSITDVINLTSTMTYDAGSFITTLTTPYGATTFSYTESGPDRSLDMTDPLGFTERLESRQNAPGMPISDPRGMPAGMDSDNQYLYYRNSFYWDKHAYSIAAGDYTKAKIQHWYHDLVNFSWSSDALASTQNPLEGRVWWRTPNDNGLTSGTFNKPRQIGRVLDDGSSQVTNLLYNKLGNLASLTDPAGRYTKYVYAPNGIDIASVRKNGPTGSYVVIAQYAYNSQHLPLTYTDAAGQTTQYAYNAVGQLTSETNALGQVTAYEYDTLGQRTRVINANDKTAWLFTYDAFGRVATRTDSEGRAESYGYDDFDRLTLTTYPDASTEKRSYDKLDLASITDRRNRATSYSHDANRNLTSVKDPLQRSTSFSYYRNGALRTLTDPKGNLTTWQRDLQSRVVGKTYADGSAETFTWEPYGGRLQAHSDASGRSQTYTNRKDNLIASIAYAGGSVPTPTVRFSYDPVFVRLVSMTDGSGTTTYRYGAVGAPGALKLSTEDGPFANDDIAYTYDALGRTRQRSVAGSPETFGFDAIGRVSSDVNALGNVSYSYLGETQQMLKRSIGSSVASSFGYETNTNDGRLKSIVNAGTRGYQLASNPMGLITSIAETGSAPRTWTTSYDAADRLTGASLSTGGDYIYGYDAADNNTSFQTPDGNSTASYGATNQLTSLAGAAVSHDAAGNLIEDAQRTYLWDAAGRLVTINYKGLPNLKSEFRYDGLGRRIAIVETAGSNITETRYLWCGSKLCQARDAADNVTRRYLEAGEFRPVSSSRNYYDRDQLGSIRNVSNVVNGAVLSSLDFDPYGRLTSSSGTPTASDFRYAGMLYHAASGLYLTWHRVYDASKARWLSRDPAGEMAGSNLYAYVGGDPVNFADPQGLVKTPPFWCTWCDAPHGGYAGDYCPDCDKKSRDPNGGVPPNPTPPEEPDPTPNPPCPDDGTSNRSLWLGLGVGALIIGGILLAPEITIPAILIGAPLGV